MKIAPFTAGGGVALYIRLGYSYSMRYDLKIGSIENLWIETNDTVVGVSIQPQIFHTGFLDKLEKILHNVYLSQARLETEFFRLQEIHVRPFCEKL